MKPLNVAFDILEDEAKIPVGCNKASGHLVFDDRVFLESKVSWAKHDKISIGHE